jgi:hypothetical protein
VHGWITKHGHLSIYISIYIDIEVVIKRDRVRLMGIIAGRNVNRRQDAWLMTTITVVMAWHRAISCLFRLYSFSFFFLTNIYFDKNTTNEECLPCVPFRSICCILLILHHLFAHLVLLWLVFVLELCIFFILRSSIIIFFFLSWHCCLWPKCNYASMRSSFFRCFLILSENDKNDRLFSTSSSTIRSHSKEDKTIECSHIRTRRKKREKRRRKQMHERMRVGKKKKCE